MLSCEVVLDGIAGWSSKAAETRCKLPMTTSALQAYTPIAFVGPVFTPLSPRQLPSAAIIVVARNRSLSSSASFISSGHIYVPFKSGQDIPSNSSSARPPIPTAMSTASSIRQQHSEGDESSEPENHGESLYSKDSIVVSCGGKSAGSDDEIGDGEKSPDRGEDEEVDLRR